MADASPDYANNPLTPTQVTWTADGTGFRTTLSNAVGGSDPKDYVTFTVPAGQRLTSFELSSYSSSDGVAFIALQPGLTVTGSESNTTPFSGYTHFGSSSSLKVGTNLISVLGGPLEAGSYSAWIQQLGASTDYSFTLKTVQLTPTYGLTATSTSVNEGANAVFNLTTTNISAGTVLTYTLSGVTESDITGGLLTGTVTIGANGQGTITVGIAADLQTDGTDTLKVTVGTASATMTIADTSKGVYLNGTSANDKLVGEISNDSLYGNTGDDTLDGGAGNDYLSGGDGNDSLVGGSGNDSLSPGNGFDLSDGGDGNDSINKYGMIGNSTLLGGDGNDVIWGGIGDDLIDAGPGDDHQVIGFEGNDTVIGGDGNDNISGGDGNDSLIGGLGNDSLYGNAGVDTLEGGDGNDLLSKYLAKEPALLLGGDGADTVWGSDSNDTVYAGNGNDPWVEGNEGNDQIFGGEGNDSVYGGFGNDLVSGENGSDYVTGWDGDDTLLGGDGNDTLYGGEGNDSVEGGAGNDVLVEQSGGQDSLFGGDGDDDINAYTGIGNKFLDGGKGNDTIVGGNGNDTIIGGDGSNHLEGSYGDDTFYIFSSQDRISDYAGSDTAIVSTDWAKIPSSIEKVIYTNGANALPYWIDALLPDYASGRYFDSLLESNNVMYFSFPSEIPLHDLDSRSKGYTPFNSVQKSQALTALSYIETITNINFIETSDINRVNSINFAYNDQTDSGGYAFGPASLPYGSDVYINNADYNLTLGIGTYGLGVLMHELGHALGLKHPINTAKEGQSTPDLGPFIPDSEARTSITIMGQKENDRSSDFFMSVFDIAALQYLYGPSKTVRTGNDTYVLKTGEANFVWDGVGNDTISAVGANQPVTLYLEPGYWSYFGAAKAATITSAGQITINFGSTIEGAVGTAYGDLITGNATANYIDGGAGSDTLSGQAGGDRLKGGAGSDKLDGGDGIDTAIFEKVRSAYKTEKLIQDNTTLWKVTDLVTGDVDELRNIEKLEFAKASVAGYQNLVQTEVTLDVAGTPAVAYRLYKAAFARDPDLGGLGYWISALEQYLNPSLSPEKNPFLLDVAKTFVESPEFKAKYGADVDNATYIRNLYKNALGRDPLIPDPITGKTDEGYTYWVGVLDAKAASRSDLFVYFSESAENKAAIAPIIATGVEYVPWVPPGG
jgi:serralysin